jgi:PAS domain S-box-containing protein
LWLVVAAGPGVARLSVVSELEFMEQGERVVAALSDEGRSRLLLDAVTDYAIYMLDPTGVVWSWNTGAERFKGYKASEILGQHFSRFYTDEDQAAGLPRRALDTAAREGRFENEGWRVRKDGTRFWAHVIIDPIRAPDGALVGFAKVTRDLTERRRAAEALKRSEEQFRLLIQGVTDYAIYMLDPDGRVSSWNSGAQRIKGYRAEEIVGEHFSRFFTHEDREKGEPWKALATASRVGRVESEGWRLRKDGTRFWAHAIIDAIRNESGQPIGFAKITRDITERKDHQRALEEAREALFQSQKMEAVGRLSGGVAHDFNNLLMAVLGSLELLRKRLPADPKITRLLDNAIQGAQRGTALTQRMLVFARRQELKLEPVDVTVVVRGMLDLLQRSLGPGIAIDTRFSPDVGLVMADSNQLELALLNLAVNARDAMPDGGLLTVAAHTADVTPGSVGTLKPGRYVCLSVIDTGEGMDAETLSRAVEPFFTTKGPGKGTGLGLSAVHGLAEESGGRLVLRSEKSRGTSAEIWLPLAAAADAPRQGKQAAAAAEASVRALTILAVDDDRLVLMNTGEMLRDMGHTVFEATSGQQALDIVRREKVDLVVTDQAMPNMTGTQLVERIRAELPGLPIVLTTGFAELPPGVKVDLPKLAKPFQLHDLARAVAGAMQQQPTGAAVLKFRAR